jgi:hypothetical protein
MGLQDEVAALLISKHDFLPDEATLAIEEAVRHNPDHWTENADPEDLASFLASEEDDE